jgi:hypothetical protein
MARCMPSVGRSGLIKLIWHNGIRLCGGDAVKRRSRWFTCDDRAKSLGLGVPPHLRAPSAGADCHVVSEFAPIPGGNRNRIRPLKYRCDAVTNRR